MASENYVVRIYRRDQRDPKRVAGVVEHIGNQQSRAFHNLSELAQLLAPAPQPPGERTSNIKPGCGNNK